MNELEHQLKIEFLEEASQLIADAEHCFLELEHDPNNIKLLDQILRLAHNLKGSARAVGFEDLGVFTHHLESLLLKIKNGKLELRNTVVTLLLHCNDHLKSSLDRLKNNLQEVIDNSALLMEMENVLTQSPEKVEANQLLPFPPLASSPTEKLEHFSLTKLPPLNTQSNTSVSEALASETLTQINLLQEPSRPQSQQTSAKILKLEPPVPASLNSTQSAEAASASQAENSIRVNLTRLESLLNLVGEIVIFQTILKEQALLSNSHAIVKTVQQMGKSIKELQNISLNLRMVPFRTTFHKMQRIVRDTSDSLDKKVTLRVEGEEVEIDKTILEKLSDPLVHLIRNAVDHGIESSDIRKENGKPESGQVELLAYHRSGKLLLEVKDDGGGIDPKIIRAKAIEKGLISSQVTLTDDAVIQLIFAPGFSTKAIVTEVSGRGVGMDVVKTNIENLHGSVRIYSEVGKGTTFQIELPLTLAIIDGIIVKTENDRIIIPLNHVHESVRPTAESLQNLPSMGEILMVRGEPIPLIRLGSLLGSREKEKDPSEGIALIFRSQGKPFCILVKEILGQHQVVVKKLGAEISHLRGFSGSAILGDGKPALILEVSELVNTKSSKPSEVSAGRAFL